MTRETKIGLLVGLAFIIVIGVLLSDHLTSATTPKMSSQMVDVGDKVYGGLVTPGGPNANKNVTINPPGNVLPADQVPSRVETARPANPVTSIIDISAAPPVDRRSDMVPDSRTSTTTMPPVRMIEDNPGIAVAPPVAVAPVTSITPIRPLPGSEAAPVAVGAKREHKAQAGDTVSKMAYKYYGKNTKELRDLITKANPSLQRSPDKIVVGQLYVIPPAPSAASQDTVATSTVSRTLMATATTQPAPGTSAAAGGTKTYTVKANDSLWRIATEQCHDVNAAKQILALNKDVLKGSDHLQVGMKLKLPEKKVS